MRHKTITRTWMIVTILLVGAAAQTSAWADEEKPLKGWLSANTVGESLSWDDLPDGIVEPLKDLIVNDENSALLPPGEGPSGLPSELQHLSGDGSNNVGGKTKYDIFGLGAISINWPTGTLYLWEYSIWMMANGDTLFTLNTLTLTFNLLSDAPHTIFGTETVIGGTGRFMGATGNLEVSGTEANSLAFLTFEGSITIVGNDDEDD